MKINNKFASKVLFTAFIVILIASSLFVGVNGGELVSYPASYPVDDYKKVNSTADLTELFTESKKMTLVISSGKSMMGFNLENFTYSSLTTLNNEYEYDLNTDYFLNSQGGKILFNESFQTTKNLKDFYFHKAILNPYTDKILSFYFKDLASDFKLFLNNKELKLKNRIAKNYITPIGWISKNEILVGEYYNEAAFIEKVYKINVVSNSITELTHLSKYRIKSAYIFNDNLIALTEVGLTIINYKDGKVKYSNLKINGEIILGVIGNEKIDLLLDSYETNNLALRVTTATPFLYWPVIEDHNIACDVGCYSGHKGIDIGVSTAFTTPIRAAASGKVVAIDNSQPVGKDRVTSPGSGNYVKLEHNINGAIYYTIYLHLNTNIAVSLNQNVNAGTILGYGANSGFTCGFETASNGGCQGYPGSYSHLHFQVNGSCGNDSCWLNPASENLWFKNSQGIILDPPISSACGSNNVSISNQTINSNFICTASNSIIISPETLLIPNSTSEIKFYIL